MLKWESCIPVQQSMLMYSSIYDAKLTRMSGRKPFGFVLVKVYIVRHGLYRESLSISFVTNSVCLTDILPSSITPLRMNLRKKRKDDQQHHHCHQEISNKMEI